MRGITRRLLNRRLRLLLWFVVRLAPLRYLVAMLLVRQGRRSVTKAICAETPLPPRQCRRIARSVRRSAAGKLVGRRARRTVSRLIRLL